MILEGGLVIAACVGYRRIVYPLHRRYRDPERLVLGNGYLRFLSPLLPLFLRESSLRSLPGRRFDGRQGGLTSFECPALDGGGRVGERGAHEEGRRQGQAHRYQEQAHHVQDRVPDVGYGLPPRVL